MQKALFRSKVTHFKNGVIVILSDKFQYMPQSSVIITLCIFYCFRMPYFRPKTGTVGNIEVKIRICLTDSAISKYVHL